MRFTLIYDGDLFPTGNNATRTPHKKWEVRRAFDPQLRQLWKERPDLDYLMENSVVPKDGHYIWTQPHPLHPESEEVKRHRYRASTGNDIDLCEPLRRGSRMFFPLVRKSLGLTCGLKILFLRHEPRGKIFEKGIESGDLDNRIKTLVDALGPPRDSYDYTDATLVDPVYCLYEDDELVTAIDVRTEQLLSPQGSGDKEVRLVIEVDVRVAYPRSFNLFFGGE